MTGKATPESGTAFGAIEADAEGRTTSSSKGDGNGSAAVEDGGPFQCGVLACSKAVCGCPQGLPLGSGTGQP